MKRRKRVITFYEVLYWACLIFTLILGFCGGMLTIIFFVWGVIT